jgi:hypothetical protein
MLYTEGENAEKQKEGKDKNKGNNGDETSKPEAMLAIPFQLLDGE